MEIATLTNDAQAMKILKHIIDHHMRNILVQGGPGFGKTKLAEYLIRLFGWTQVKASSFAASLVENMIARGINDSSTFHSLCMQALMSMVRQSNLFKLLTKEESIQRENERVRKGLAIFNTMYPPTGMETEPATIPSSANVPGRRSLIYRVFASPLNELMVFAHTARFGLPAIDGPTNTETGAVGGLPAGPDPANLDEWKRLATKHFVDQNLVEFIGKMETDDMTALYDLLSIDSDGEPSDIHKMVTDKLVSFCPLLFTNMFTYFDRGTITLPNGTETSKVWLHNDDGTIMHLHRSNITFTEMIYKTLRYNLKVLKTYKLIFFVDEFNDLTPLQVHLLLRIYRDARTIAWLCNRPMMQFVFVGDQRQSIYAFQGALDDPIPFIVAAFAIAPSDVLIGDGTHRNPDTHIQYTNEYCGHYPDVFCDAEGKQLLLRAINPGNAGVLETTVNVDTVQFPPCVDLAVRENADNAKTVMVIARNQRDVVDYIMGRIQVHHEDWALNTTAVKTTTRQLLLEQLKFFNKHKMWTLQQMCAYLTKNQFMDKYKARRSVFLHVVAICDEEFPELSETDPNAHSVLDAIIKSRYSAKPSREGKSIHGSKGEQAWGVLLLAPDTVPSPRAIQVQFSHPFIYRADVKAKFVAITRSFHTMWIGETDVEKAKREKNDDDDDAQEEEGESSQQSCLSDVLSAHEPPPSTPDEQQATTMALGVLEMDHMPTDMTAFSAYIKSKRKLLEKSPGGSSSDEVDFHGDISKLARFDEAMNTVRKAMLFQSPATSTATTTARSVRHTASTSQRSLELGEPLQVGQEMSDRAMQAQLDVSHELQHLVQEQQVVACGWIMAGFSMAIADACAINYYEFKTHQECVRAAMDDERDLAWQQLVATALGVGEWAADWQKRHTHLLLENDKAFAQALAEVEPASSMQEPRAALGELACEDCTIDTSDEMGGDANASSVGGECAPHRLRRVSTPNASEEDDEADDDEDDNDNDEDDDDNDSTKDMEASGKESDNGDGLPDDGELIDANEVRSEDDVANSDDDAFIDDSGADADALYAHNAQSSD